MDQELNTNEETMKYRVVGAETLEIEGETYNEGDTVELTASVAEKYMDNLEEVDEEEDEDFEEDEEDEEEDGDDDEDDDDDDSDE